MCFSASSSFTASALLTCVGIIAVRYSNPKLKLFSATPLLFAIQQASEGIIWLSYGQAAATVISLTPTSSAISWQQWQTAATYLFLLFAFIIWPVWIPINFVRAETDPSRKKWLLPSLGCGILFSVAALVYLVMHGATSSIQGNHVVYQSHPIGIPDSLANILYALAVIVPCFISSIKHIWLLGLGLAGSYIATWLWFPGHIASVWCFYAAVLSGLLLFIVLEERPRGSTR